MTLNFDKVGKYLAKIEGGKYSNKIVSVFTEGKDEDEVKKSFTSLKLVDDAHFQQVPDPDTERQILYITGASGSGKSTYTANYCKQYRKTFKDNEIYLFSALGDDESLDVVKPKRVIIDDRLIEDPLKVEDFENSLVIFDDTDVLSNKKHREAVYTLLNSILETGRHFRISCVLTNHLATNGKDTRRILNECHSITYFPSSGSLKSLKYLLTEYIGLDKKDMVKIKKMKSRWATIFKNYPQIAMTNRDIWILAEDE